MHRTNVTEVQIGSVSKQCKHCMWIMGLDAIAISNVQQYHGDIGKCVSIASKVRRPDCEQSTRPRIPSYSEVETYLHSRTLASMDLGRG